MQHITKNKSSLRKPSRGEKLGLALLVLVFVVLGNVEDDLPFAPFDWFQQRITAQINTKPYTGDGLVVAITESTLEELDGSQWRRSELAKVLTEVAKAGPSKIAVGNQYFSSADESGSEELEAALSTLNSPVFWEVDLAPEDVKALGSGEPAPSSQVPRSDSTKLDQAVRGHVTPTAMTLRPFPFAAPIESPFTIFTQLGDFASTAQALSSGSAPQSNVFNVDLAYDPLTVPRLSAVAILDGQFDNAELRDKTILIAHVDNLSRDFIATPNGGNYTSRAALTILAAQTLSSGPPVKIGWLPAFLVCMGGAMAWTFLRRPLGRLVALVTLILVLVSTIPLEQRLIFQSTSQGVFLLVTLAIGKVWMRGREAIQTYRSAAESKSRFLAQASHDLRQPIHAIGLLSERLAQTELSSDQTELVRKITWSVDNASRMFRALLDIAAIESGTLQTEITTVSINELLAEIDSQNALAAQQADVDLRLIPSSVVIRTDRVLVGTMLQNLVSNAVKYAPHGKVVVGCRRNGQFISLHVVDNGRGISQAELKVVENEFYRSSESSILRSENKGLGLAIVNRLARLLNLNFVLSSQEGRGTVAVITELETVDNRAPLIGERKAQELPLTGLRVAVADDDEETLRSTQRLLEQWGCEVEAFDCFPNKVLDHDVLLTDFDFGNGDTLAQRIDALRPISVAGIQLIILSGHHPDTVRENVPGIPSLILTKPLRAAELRSALMSSRIAIRSG
ncbi:MAG: ATP-binding protein [Pseudomonadota bacterium]